MAYYSRAAWESWQDIFDAVADGLIDPLLVSWRCPNNPFVIICHAPRQERLSDDSQKVLDDNLSELLARW